MNQSNSSGFVLKGKHVLAILLAYFGTVIGVNAYMATVAVKTFSGMEAAKPYQEGLRYDDEIARARAQEQRAWKVEASVRAKDDGAIVEVTQADAAGFATPGLTFKATFLHPADRRRDVSVDLVKVDAGRYTAVAAVPAGHWDLKIEAGDGREPLFRSVSRIDLAPVK